MAPERLSQNSRKQYDLRHLTASDVQALGERLLALQTTSRSMDSAAQRAAALLHLAFKDPSDESACALSRVFKTHRCGQLNSDLQYHARLTAPTSSFSDGTPCLVLLGSAGDLPNWNSRHLSEGHKAIPIPSVEVIERAPMIANLFRQLGVDLEWLVEPKPSILLMQQRTFNVFFVPDAVGSELIPAQHGFVLQHQIRSVVGFGGILPSGEVFVGILFLKISIPREVAVMFSSVALSLRSLLMLYEDAVFAS